MGRAHKQAKRDMAKMEREYGKDYVGYHSSIAKNEETTAAQRFAYDERHQGEGKANASKKRIKHTGGRK